MWFSMTPAVPNPLQEDIRSVTGDLVRMLSLVKEACELARRGLIDQDVVAAKACIAGDDAIDAVQADLEMRVLTIIARRQPAARDLRFLGAAYQAILAIERAGDYAEHVASAAIVLADQPPLKRYTDSQRIFEVLGRMIETTMKAFAEADLAAAQRAHAMDNEIDELYRQIQDELLTYMIESPETVARANRLLEVARYLERLGDHIENVNEHVVFWLTGKRL